MQIQINLHFPTPLDSNETSAGINKRLSRINEILHEAIVTTEAYSITSGAIMADADDPEPEQMIVGTYEVKP